MRSFLICLISLVLISCQKQEEEVFLDFPALMEIPDGFEPISFPDDNAFTYERWNLGKELFFDPVLSVDSTVSCASCHLPELAFSDDQATSPGVMDRVGTRNSPSLANVAYQPYFTREGGVPTLEMQILVPIQEHNEFDFNILMIADRLNKIDRYISMSHAAYGRDPDAFVITRAISNFERSLISGNSRFDQFFFQDQSEALSEKEKRGLDLFLSERTNCSKCHSGFNFSNYAFENNGLYEVYPDPGRFRLTNEDSDLAIFKVPSLRNVEITGPYMHDGSIHSLEEVIQHYNQGGANHIHKSNLVQPLALSGEEQSDLIAFLKTLTDETFINNPNFKNE